MSYTIAWIDDISFKIFGSIEGVGAVCPAQDNFVASIKVNRLKIVNSDLEDHLPNYILRDFYNFTRDAAIDDLICWLNDTNKINKKVGRR